MSIEDRVDPSLFQARVCSYGHRQQQTAQANNAAIAPLDATQQRLVPATNHVAAAASW